MICARCNGDFPELHAVVARNGAQTDPVCAECVPALLALIEDVVAEHRAARRAARKRQRQARRRARRGS